MYRSLYKSIEFVQICIICICIVSEPEEAWCMIHLSSGIPFSFSMLKWIAPPLSLKQHKTFDYHTSRKVLAQNSQVEFREKVQIRKSMGSKQPYHHQLLFNRTIFFKRFSTQSFSAPQRPRKVVDTSF